MDKIIIAAAVTVTAVTGLVSSTVRGMRENVPETEEQTYLTFFKLETIPNLSRFQSLIPDPIVTAFNPTSKSLFHVKAHFPISSERYVTFEVNSGIEASDNT